MYGQNVHSVEKTKRKIYYLHLINTKTFGGMYQLCCLTILLFFFIDFYIKKTFDLHKPDPLKFNINCLHDIDILVGLKAVRNAPLICCNVVDG